MSKNLVGEDRGVVHDIDTLDRKGGYFRQQNAPESIGDRSIYADEGEDGFIFLILVNLHREPIPKFGERPGVVFSGVVAREVSRGDVGDGLGIDANNL